jgi:hypothetical protein
MVIIPIDNFNKKSGIQGDHTPKMSMKAKGEIRLNIAAVNLLGLKDATPIYIHFYNDEKTSNYYIKLDNDKTHGIRMIYAKDKAKCSTFSKNTANYFIDLENIGGQSIVYEILPSDFGKFLLNKVNS